MTIEHPAEIRECSEEISHSPLYNDDIAPVPAAGRKWGMWDIAALWVGMSVCIPTYMLASSLIQGGMNWWQGILTVFLGNLIVLLPMVLVAHAGTRYGVPFPVLARSSFGLLGANVPSILRGIVACGWFGIQSWIGGQAVHQAMSVAFDGWKNLPTWDFGFVGNLPAGAWIGFLLFWALNMAIIWRGIESIRFLEKLGAPFLIAIGLGLLAWAHVRAGGFGPMLAKPHSFANTSEFLKFFFPALTGMVGFWATLSLNIPDFTRYVRTQRDQMLGQALGLNTTMPLFAFIGVAVTSATQIIYGEQIWDPVALLGRFSSVPVVMLSLVALAVATLTTNLAANVVAPANAFTNLAPTKLTFRGGGVLTGVLGVLMMPWKLVADPTGYIFTWLIGYSALLGPIAGVLIADYFVLRRKELCIEDLYRDGQYTFSGGFSGRAMVALVLGILPSLPGFLETVHVIDVGGIWHTIYTYAWFVGFAAAFVIHLVLGKLAGVSPNR